MSVSLNDELNKGHNGTVSEWLARVPAEAIEGNVQVRLAALWIAALLEYRTGYLTSLPLRRRMRADAALRRSGGGSGGRHMSSILGRSLGTRGLAALAILGFFPQLLSAAPDIALQMSVDVAVPAAGQPVEFTVKASNVGDAAAAGVVVNDKLPVELAIPAGRAAFTSVGTYDPATGAWSIGSLDPGASATLVIPAVVVAPAQPPCIINIAETSHGLVQQQQGPVRDTPVRRVEQ